MFTERSQAGVWLRHAKKITVRLTREVLWGLKSQPLSDSPARSAATRRPAQSRGWVSVWLMDGSAVTRQLDLVLVKLDDLTANRDARAH
jgi:hypothetical protein